MNKNIARTVAWVIATEGTVTIAKGSHGKKAKLGFCLHPNIVVSSTSRELIEAFRNLVKLGSINHWIPQNKQHSPVWIWRVSKLFDAKYILESIAPFLPIKKTEAELSLRFCQIRLRNRYKHLTDEELSIYQRIREIHSMKGRKGNFVKNWNEKAQSTRREKDTIERLSAERLSAQ